MASQKYEPMLNLALDSNNEERVLSESLDVGYNEVNNTWTVIARYSGSIEFLKDYNIDIEYLEGYYAILRVPDIMLRRLSEFQEIIYVEMPKKLYVNISNAISASCISPLTDVDFPDGGLTGEGVLCGVIDSGIDIFHSAFRNNDGSTRILEIWDQTIEGKPPAGYFSGSVFNEEDINKILQEKENGNRNVQIPARDVSGHGTHVAGIMAGNFAQNKDNSIGIATQSKLVVVKLNTNTGNGFPSTIELMEAINYVYQAAVRYRMPVSINISFGNSYGSHDGTSLLETYIDNISKLWKMCICIGAGNEGASAGHSHEIFKTGEAKRVSFNVGNYERTINIQIWKGYEDEFDFYIYPPGGIDNYKISNSIGASNVTLGHNKVLIYYGEPSPYSRFQEIYIEIIPFYKGEQYITSGIWSIVAIASKAVTGRLDMWLPDAAILSEATGFTNPSPETTLTIPSTTTAAISVGGYDAQAFSYADFSGRGFTRMTNQVKPDLVAPAVNIISAAPGGGLTTKSGTSMACPFVSGSAALLMEWGIVRGNDAYLYGEKVKAYLVRGARPLQGEPQPSERQGWGRLCLYDSFPR